MPPTQEVITRDNAVIVVNAIAFIKVTDPVKAVYGVEDYVEAIRNMIMTTLRSIVGEMDLDHALSSRDMIKARLKAGEKIYHIIRLYASFKFKFC